MTAASAYREIAALLVRRGVRPYVWNVVDHVANAPSVGLGVSDAEDKAKAAVEETMTRYQEHAAYGVLEGPAARECCLRNNHGGYTWTPADA